MSRCLFEANTELYIGHDVLSSFLPLLLSCKIWKRLISLIVGFFCRGAQVQRVLSVDFLRKYVHYARYGRPAPILGDEAIESIADFYANLRQLCASHSDGRKIHVIPTARCLEACVRLATAHARLKLKTVVDVEDAVEVQQLLLFTLLGELPPDSKSEVEGRSYEATLSPTVARQQCAQTAERESCASTRRKR